MSSGNKLPSRRQYARMSHISHTTQNRGSNAYLLACERGVGDEFMALVKGGMTVNKAVEKLLPDLSNQWKIRQHVASFRCAVRCLIKDGYSEAEIVESIRFIAASQNEPQSTNEASNDE